MLQPFLMMTFGRLWHTCPFSQILLTGWSVSHLSLLVYHLPVHNTRDGVADWGATPTLFPGLNGHTYIGCINKNSIYYVFDEANLNVGPIWELKLGVGGALAGRDASFASSPYVNGVLFIGTALTTVNGTSYASSIGAFNGLTGQQIWRLGLPGRLYPSPITANGLLFDQQNRTFEVRDQSNGNLLYSYTVSANGLKGSVTVLNGMVYLPTVQGKLYVFGL
jgi:hypothetical protein